MSSPIAPGGPYWGTEGYLDVDADGEETETNFTRTCLAISPSASVFAVDGLEDVHPSAELQRRVSLQQGSDPLFPPSVRHFQ
jgi:hypothetical protein